MHLLVKLGRRPVRSVFLLAAFALAQPQAAGQVLLRSLGSVHAEEEGYFGIAVAGVPDVDGDGRGDLLVGARGEDPGTSPDDAGRAYVFSGANGTLLYELASPNEEDLGYFGRAVSGVDDVDGDGRGDLLVGAPGEGDGTVPGLTFAGRVYVFSGATGERLYTLRSPRPRRWGNFGRAVAGVPDVDGDGRGDLLVGAYGDSHGPSPSDAGWAYVFSGATGTLLRELSSPSGEEGGSFGGAVAGMPDADGDGRGDLLVGAPAEEPDTSPDYAGRAYVFSGATGALLHALRSPDEVSKGVFGYSVSGVDDVDGDGRGDLLVGANREGTGYSPGWREGRAYVFSGSTGDLLHALRPPRQRRRARFGLSVSGVPDVDGDGRGDLLVGAPFMAPTSWLRLTTIRAYVFSGRTGYHLQSLNVPGGERNGRFGFAVSGVEDVDGDGRGDFFLGAPRQNGAGRDTGGAFLFRWDPTVPLPLAVSAEPLDGSVPPGDSLHIGVEVTNATALPATVALRFDAEGPGGLAFVASLGDSLTVEPGSTGARTASVPVPPEAPQGFYRGTVTALREGNTVVGLSAFEFRVVPTTASELEPELERDFAVWPNPSRGAATVSFGLAAASAVRLAVYDVLGREVAVLADGVRPAGRHEAVFEAPGLPGGAYLVRLVAGETVATRRLTLVR